MKKWLDVDPSQTYYRAILEADKIRQTYDDPFSIVRSKLYNAFEANYPRKVYTFTTKENQTMFDCPGYKPHAQNLVSVYIDGVFTSPSKTEDNKIYISNPIAGGLEVVIICSGVPLYVNGGKDGCMKSPTLMDCGGVRLPSIDLKEKANYTYNVGYVLNEKVFVMGQSLERAPVYVMAGETDAEAAYRVIGGRKGLFTILNGVLYVSMEYNDVPMTVNYNYLENGIVKNRQNEPVKPHSSCPLYQDRFFPAVKMLRYEFYVILNRLRENIYNRYTDSKFSNSSVKVLNRTITDVQDMLGTWYEGEVLNMLEEKFHDGCYVMPLYADGSFRPTECITRAEMVVSINRLLEWALERFK